MIKLEMPNIQGLVEHVGKEIQSRVSNRTPVRTGTARDGWDLTVSPATVRINNSVPYIGILENGTSTHKANNMVRTTMEEVPSIIENYLRNNK
jgi:hypothetical protein